MNQRTPGLKAHGAWEVKRRFPVPALNHERDEDLIEERIGSLKGVRATQTDINRRRVTVVYDITELSYRDLLAVLEDCGFPVPSTWWSRLKTTWFQGGDEIGRENAHARAAPCCSNPESILRSKNH